MNRVTTPPCRSLLSRLMTGALLLHLLVAVLLSAAPDLHALLHDHAHDEGHICAIELFQKGSVEVGTSAPFCSGSVRWKLLPVVKPLERHLPSPALIGPLRERGPPMSTT